MSPKCIESLIGRETTVRGTISSKMVADFRRLIGGIGDGAAPHSPALFGLLWCVPHNAGENLAAHPSAIPEFPGYQRLWGRSEVVCIQPVMEADCLTQTATILAASAAGNGTRDAFDLTVGIKHTAGSRKIAHEVRKLAYRSMPLHWQRADADRVIEEHESWQLQKVEIGVDDLSKYSDLTGSQNLLHIDGGHCARLGLPGLVVHAPFQASLLLHFIGERYPNLKIRHFNFRPTRPLFHNSSFNLMCREHNGNIELRVVDSEGLQTMVASSNGH